MPTVSLSGSDTVVINNRSLNDFADGDVADLEFPNELMKVKTGKNGNSIYAFDNTGEQCDFKIRVIRGSDDDKFLQALLTTMKNNPAAFILMVGQFVKQAGDGAGNLTNDTYQLNGGVFTKQVPAKSNVEGDTTQSVSVYEIKFTNSDRAIL